MAQAAQVMEFGERTYTAVERQNKKKQKSFLLNPISSDNPLPLDNEAKPPIGP